jgi:hypothetical protein
MAGSELPRHVHLRPLRRIPRPPHLGTERLTRAGQTPHVGLGDDALFVVVGVGDSIVVQASSGIEEIAVLTLASKRTMTETSAPDLSAAAGGAAE